MSFWRNFEYTSDLNHHFADLLCQVTRQNPFVHNLFLGLDCLHMGLPLPRPIPGPPGASPPDLGFLMVSSTERMRHVASEAAVIALILTTAGSHTKPSKLSHMSSFIMLTPDHSAPVDRQ